jgi:hypothetical protein
LQKKVVEKEPGKKCRKRLLKKDLEKKYRKTGLEKGVSRCSMREMSTGRRVRRAA